MHLAFAVFSIEVNVDNVCDVHTETSSCVLQLKLLYLPKPNFCLRPYWRLPWTWCRTMPPCWRYTLRENGVLNFGNLRILDWCIIPHTTVCAHLLAQVYGVTLLKQSSSSS